MRRDKTGMVSPSLSLLKHFNWYGVPIIPNFAQKTYSSTFSTEGKRIYSELAGKPIDTIDDLTKALKDGAIKVSDITVDYIEREGNILILNTRTSEALRKAGIPRSQWNAVNKTGDSVAERLLTDQLDRNNLTSSGVSTIRPGRK